MPRAPFREGLAPTCACEDPWECTKRAPHRTWTWRTTGLIEDADGNRVRKAKAGYSDRRAAIKAREDFESDVRNGRAEVGREREDKRLTIAELFEWWWPIKQSRIPEYSENSLRNWERDKDSWVSEIGDVIADELTIEQVDRVLTKWAQPRDPSDRPKGHAGRWVARLSIETLERRRATLKGAIYMGQKLSKIAVRMNVASGRSTAIGQSLDPAFPTNPYEWTATVDLTSFNAKWGPDQTAQFLDALVGHKWEALYNMYIYSAARRGEWLGARRTMLQAGGIWIVGTCRIVTVKDRLAGKGVCDVCSKQHTGRVLVARTKNAATKGGRIEKKRWLTLPTEALALLDAYLNRQAQLREEKGVAYIDHHLIFAEEDGSPIYPGNVTNEFNRIVKSVPGLPMINLHDLRSNAASLWLARGIPAAVVAKMTGHDEAVLKAYYDQTHPDLVSDMFQKANDVVTGRRLRSVG